MGKLHSYPYEDYGLNERANANYKYLHMYPAGHQVFDGKVPETYERFRHTWLLMRRSRPHVGLGAVAIPFSAIHCSIVAVLFRGTMFGLPVHRLLTLG